MDNAERQEKHKPVIKLSQAFEKCRHNLCRFSTEVWPSLLLICVVGGVTGGVCQKCTPLTIVLLIELDLERSSCIPPSLPCYILLILWRYRLDAIRTSLPKANIFLSSSSTSGDSHSSWYYPRLSNMDTQLLRCGIWNLGTHVFSRYRHIHHCCDQENNRRTSTPFPDCLPTCYSSSTKGCWLQKSYVHG